MRKLATHEGVTENGHVKLPVDEGTPGKPNVYIVVSNSEKIAHVASPHLANPEQAKDFETRIIEMTTDPNV